MIAFLAALGAAWGAGERWLLRRRSPARLVLLAGALSAALLVEAGLPAMAVTLRAAAVVAGAAWLAERSVRSRTLDLVRNDQCENPTGALLAARACTLTAPVPFAPRRNTRGRARPRRARAAG